MHTPEADPDLLGDAAQRAEYDLGTGRGGKAGEEVMLHKPEVVEPDLVGQLALGQSLLIQAVPVEFGAAVRPLHLVKYAEFHAVSPYAG